ncbi:ribosome maturation factor RimM [Buchnera aphidicola]|uniref:ribosome maturation factor RimM n=1 Tax=Buchnera aphidicola TaxID=9 RepID=UPI003BEF3183
MKKNNIIKEKNDRIIIGKFGKTYGILGWITLFSFTEKKENIFHYSPWFIIEDKYFKKIDLNTWKKHKNNFIVNIKNIINRSIATQFTNKNILIYANQLPKLKNDEYYWQDIINYKVFNTKNIYLGNVINLIRTAYNDILIIKNQFQLLNKKEILIPIIYYKIIKKIDNTNKIIYVNWN